MKVKLVEEGHIETYSCIDNLAFQVSTPLKLKKTLISLTKDCDDSLSSISIKYDSDKDPAYVANS